MKADDKRIGQCYTTYEVLYTTITSLPSSFRSDWKSSYPYAIRLFYALASLAVHVAA